MDDVQPEWPSSLCVHSDDYRSASPGRVSRMQSKLNKTAPKSIKLTSAVVALAATRWEEEILTWAWRALDSLASKTRIQTAPFCVLSALLCLGAYGSVETGAAAEAATHGVFPPPVLTWRKNV
jgi:hypothetical protein